MGWKTMPEKSCTREGTAKAEKGKTPREIRLYCRVMFDDRALSNDPAAKCPGCEFKFEGLPKNARFCPSCGRKLLSEEERAALGFPPPKRTLRERIEQLRTIFSQNMGAGGAPPGLEQLHSLMVLGYADAMLHLGWRYEAGQGVPRSGHDAERCYSKSARLGNEEAKARLADKNVESARAIPIQDDESSTGPDAV